MTNPTLRGHDLDYWVRQLADLDANTRQNACTAVGLSGGRSLIGTPVVPALHELLNDPTGDVAVFAMWALSLIANPRSIDPIIARMNVSPELRGGGGVSALSSWEEQAKSSAYPNRGETFIVVYGLIALADIGDHQVEPFIRSLTATDVGKRYAAHEALHRMGLPSSFNTSPPASSGCTVLIVVLSGTAFATWLLA